MNKLFAACLLVGCFAVAGEACYAATGFYTGWCSGDRVILGHELHSVQYCFRVYGEMSLYCEVTASGFPQRKNGWGNYAVPAVTDGDCFTMYWGAITARPSVRCKSYGLPVHFAFTVR